MKEPSAPVDGAPDAAQNADYQRSAEAASLACQRHGCGHPLGVHSGSEWGEKCSECPCPDYWSGKYPLHDCDEDGVCAPWCRTCGSEPPLLIGSFPDVTGRCPACGSESLFLGAGGHIACRRGGCPAPWAADDLLDAPPVHPWRAQGASDV